MIRVVCGIYLGLILNQENQGNMRENYFADFADTLCFGSMIYTVGAFKLWWLAGCGQGLFFWPAETFLSKDEIIGGIH